MSGLQLALTPRFVEAPGGGDQERHSPDVFVRPTRRPGVVRSAALGCHVSGIASTLPCSRAKASA